MRLKKNVGWLVVLRIYVALAVFQPYRDLEEGDNQSLKFKWRGGESNPKPLAPQAKSLITRSSPFLEKNVCGSKIFEIIHLIYRDFFLQNVHFSVATFTNHFIVRSPSISYHQIYLLMTTLITTSQIFIKYFNIYLDA